MAQRKAFASRLERRLAIPLLLGVVTPVFFIAWLAMQHTQMGIISAAENNLNRIAKDYGLLLVERLERQVPVNSSLTMSRDGTRILAETPSGVLLSTDWRDLAHDVDDVTITTRCIYWNHQAPCAVANDAQLSRSWRLNFNTLFRGDLQLNVVAIQSRESVLGNLSAMAAVFPYVIGLFCLIAAYSLMLFLRRRMKPLAVLRSALKQIEQGNYDVSVSIDTSDEFSLLANTINGLSTEVGRAFTFLSGMAHVDEAILQGAAARDVVKAVCLLATKEVGATCFLVALPETDVQTLIMGRVNGRDVDEMSSSEDVRMRLSALAEHAELFSLTVERDAVGYVACSVEDGVDMVRIKELIRKLSVAASYIQRAQALYRRANYDSLTGLLNRPAFVSRLQLMLSEHVRTGTKAYVLFIDLDRFKNINDSDGHTVGDRLLCIFANRLSECVREVDALARFGGDEFCIALSGIDDKLDISKVLSRIAECSAKSLLIDGKQIHVQFSIGVCAYPRDGRDVETLLKNADIAMYRAKDVHGTTYEFFDSQLNALTQQRLKIEYDLNNALSRGELNTYFQPKLDVAESRIDSFEALIRWQHPELGWIPPNEFVVIAERCGLIVPLTVLVVENTANFLRTHADRFSGRVAINLSPVHLMRTDFVQDFIDCIHAQRIDPRRLEVEVTESSFIADADAVTSKLEQLRSLGVKVALDDFGTGYSSLNLLRTLPLDSMKLDKSFIDDLCKAPEAQQLVGKLIEMAHALGIKVVAEGVETNQQFHLLCDLQCDQLQGFLISAAQASDSLAIRNLLLADSWPVPNRPSLMRAIGS